MSITTIRPKYVLTDQTYQDDTGGTVDYADVIINNLSSDLFDLTTKVGIDGSAVTSTYDYKLSGVTGTDKAISKTGNETISGLKIYSSPTINTATIGTSIVPTTDDGATLGNTTHNFSDLFLATGATINFQNGNAVITHSSGILTVGTGDLRATNAGSNTASVVTVGGTQTILNKTLTSPKINENVVLTSTATELNQLHGNNGITAANLATNAIKLAYVPKTANFTTASGTATQVTGLTATVTVPAGGRSIKITAFTGDVENDTISQYAQISIWDGTVGSGTQLAASTYRGGVASEPSGGICMAIVTPAAGSKTYNIGLSNAGGSGTAAMNASSTMPSFLLIEII